MVAALDPALMSRLSSDPGLGEVAAKARQRLWWAIGRPEEGTP